MSRYIQTFYTALQTRIRAVWPDVVDIWEDVQLERIPFEKLAKDRRLPFAVIQGDFQPANDAGVTMKADTGYIVVYLICEDDFLSTVRETIRPLLEDLRDNLWHNRALGPGSVVSKPATSWSADLPPNSYYAYKNLPFWAGQVSFEVAVGEDSLTP